MNRKEIIFIKEKELLALLRTGRVGGVAPYLKPFSTESQYEEIYKRMGKWRLNDDKLYKNITKGWIDKQKFNICPICAKNEGDDIMIHRTAQVPESIVCPWHGCYYNQHDFADKTELLHLTKYNTIMQVLYPPTELQELLTHLSREVYYLLNNPVSIYREELLFICNRQINNKGLGDEKGYLEDSIFKSIISACEKILKMRRETFVLSFNQKTNAVLNYIRTPLQYLLLIRVLFTNIQAMMEKYEEKM